MILRKVPINREKLMVMPRSELELYVGIQIIISEINYLQTGSGQCRVLLLPADRLFPFGDLQGGGVGRGGAGDQVRHHGAANRERHCRQGGADRRPDHRESHPLGHAHTAIGSALGPVAIATADSCGLTTASASCHPSPSPPAAGLAKS